MADRPTALVTGANRGIGLATARQLAEGHGYRVLMGSREERLGEQASEALVASGLSVEPVKLDVTKEADRAAVARQLERRRRPIHLLVNNAGVALDGFNEQVVRETLSVNFIGAMKLTDALLPVIADGGAIIFVSSGMGELSAYRADIRTRFIAPDLDRAGLLALLDEFSDTVGAGTVSATGWPSSAYRVSKAAVNALTRILARELAPRDIAVNSVCPGWVKTRMGGSAARRSVEQGAASIVAAATDPARPTGGFFRDGRAIAW